MLQLSLGFIRLVNCSWQKSACKWSVACHYPNTRQCCVWEGINFFNGVVVLCQVVCLHLGFNLWRRLGSLSQCLARVKSSTCHCAFVGPWHVGLQYIDRNFWTPEIEFWTLMFLRSLSSNTDFIHVLPTLRVMCYSWLVHVLIFPSHHGKK